MRVHTVVIFLSLIILGLLWTWEHFEGQIRAEIFSLEAIPTNVCRITEDLVDVLADHPSLERLPARAYIARALASCDNPCFAIEEEIDDFSTVIRLDPNYARAYLYRGCGLVHVYHCANERFNEKTQKQIISDLSMAIKLDPKGMRTANAYDILASEYGFGLQQHQKAIEVCSSAILNLAAEKARTHYRSRAWFYGKLGLHQKEIEDYSVAKKLDFQFEWADRCDVLAWQMRWIGWVLLVLTPHCVCISRRVSPVLAL